jgi:hypothetical protein
MAAAFSRAQPVTVVVSPLSRSEFAVSCRTAAPESTPWPLFAEERLKLSVVLRLESRVLEAHRLEDQLWKRPGL